MWWFERTIREWKQGDQDVPPESERSAHDQSEELRKGRVVNEERVLQRALDELNAVHVRIQQLKAEIEDSEERVVALDNFIGMYRQFALAKPGDADPSPD